MTRYNEKKSKILGQPFCAAQHQLRKMLLFALAQELDRVECFRCGQKIESHVDLSVDHKTDWSGSDNPEKLFFDLDNIAFSHLGCNSAYSGATITEDQVRAIRKSDDKVSDIANQYGLSRWQITRIRSRKSWKHVT